MSLLPNHKSKFDKKFDELFGVRLDNLDLGAINILADSCPVSLLPILAQSYDVNIEGLGEEVIRELIKNAFEIHFYSGTFYAVKKAVSAYDKDALIIEGNLSQKYNGAFKFDGSRFYGSNNHWAEYSIITSGLTDRAKAQKLKETAAWESGIYQLETTDPVVGGVDGISNKQAIQLANRTSYLKGKIESLESNSNAQLVLKRDISDSYSKTQTAALIAPKLDSVIAEAMYLKKTDKIDAYTKPESDDKFLEKTVADESFALKTELPPLATEEKAGLTKLKNSVTAKVEDAAVTEKALVDFVQSHTPPALGVAQSWSDVTSSRDTNITYTNSTDKPIMVMISGEPNMEGDLFIFVNGVKIYTQELDSMAETSISFIVPPKATYRAEAYYGNGGSSPRKLENIFNSRYKLWAELR